MNAKKTDLKSQKFEKSLEKLEELVSKLESGELSLDESLEKFEIGVELYKNCKDQLSKVEKKITKLTDSLKEEPLD